MQKETKHTPGPWEAVGSHQAWFVRTAEELKHETPGVLRVFESTAIAELRPSSPSTMEANARLIASAPETAAERDALIEALHEIRALATSWRELGKDGAWTRLANIEARAGRALESRGVK